MDSHTPLHLTRIEDCSRDLAKICRLVKSQVVRASVARITWLKMIEDISELNCELEAHALSELDVLRERCIQVPSGQTSKIAGTAAACVDAEDASPKHIKYGGGISEHVKAFRVICAYAV